MCSRLNAASEWGPKRDEGLWRGEVIWCKAGRGMYDAIFGRRPMRDILLLLVI